MDSLKIVIGEKQCPGHIYGPISKPRVPMFMSCQSLRFEKKTCRTAGVKPREGGPVLTPRKKVPSSKFDRP